VDDDPQRSWTLAQGIDDSLFPFTESTRWICKFQTLCRVRVDTQEVLVFLLEFFESIDMSQLWRVTVQQRAVRCPTQSTREMNAGDGAEKRGIAQLPENAGGEGVNNEERRLDSLDDAPNPRAQSIWISLKSTWDDDGMSHANDARIVDMFHRRHDVRVPFSIPKRVERSAHASKMSQATAKRIAEYLPVMRHKRFS